MDELKNLKKDLQCERCLKSYNMEGYKRVCRGCSVCQMCETCYRKDEEVCRTCPDRTWWDKTPVKIDMEKVIQFMDRSTKRSNEVEREIAELKTENSVLRTKQKGELELSREGYHTCMECTASESEQNLQLCKSCHQLELNSVLEHVLCASCAIKQHIRKGHDTVDFYPHLRAMKFNANSAKCTSVSKKLQKRRISLHTAVEKFNSLSKNASENFNTLSDMAQRSDSTRNQEEFFEKIKVFADETNLIHANADNDFKKHTDILEKSLAELKEWCEERVANCVDKEKVVDIPTDKVEDANNRVKKPKTEIS